MPINFSVRWADNTKEFVRNMKEGLDQVEVNRAAVEKLSNSLAGTNVTKSANNWVAALDKMGGATGALGGVMKLTSAETERAIGVFDRAIAKAEAMGKGNTALTQTYREMSAALHQTTDAATGWGNILSEMGHSWAARIAEGMLLRDAVRAVIEKVKELAVALPEIALKGAAVADVEEAFVRLTSQAGRFGATLMGELKTGTHNTITDFNLMKTANQDLAAGMNLTDKQFGTLAKGAFALAQATGTDVKAGLETMNDAMLTGRTRALALLTGKIDLVKAEEDYAKSLGSTVEHLTPEGKLEAARVAILKAVGEATERLGEQTDGLDERVAQAGVAWENFKENLGKTIATSKVLEAGMGGLKTAIEQAFGSSQNDLIQAIAKKVDDAAIALVTLARVGVQTGGVLATEWYALEKVFGDVAQIIQGNVLAFEYLALGVAKTTAAVNLSTEGQKKAAEDVKRIDDNIQSLLVTMKARGDALQDADRRQAGIGTSTKEYTKILDDLEVKMRDARVEASSFIGPLEASAAAQNRAADATGKHAGMLQASKEELAKARAEAEKYAQAIERYNSTDGPGYISILNKVGNAMYEGIAFDKARGKSTEDLVRIYKTTPDVIEQIVKAEKEYSDELKAIDKLRGIEAVGMNAQVKEWATLGTAVKGQQEAFDAYGKDYARLQDLIARETLTSTDYQIAKIEERRDAELKALNKSEDGWQIHERMIKDIAQREINDIKYAQESIIAMLARIAADVDRSPIRKSMADSVAGGVSDMGDILMRAFEGGGNIEGAMKAGLVSIAQHLFGKGGVWSQEVSKQASIAAASIQAGLAVAAGVAPAGTRGANVASYAGQGAAIGTSILPGYGTLVGAGIGAAVGALKVPEDEKAARQQLTDFKNQLADLFDKTASFSMKAAVGTDAWGKMVEEVKAAYIATGRTAQDALNDINTAADHTRNNVELLPEDLAKINKVLQQTLNFGEQATASASAVGLIDKAFLDLLKHAQQLNGVTQSMKDFVAAQTTSAGAGFDAALKIGNEAYAKRKDLLGQISKAQDQLKTETGAAADATKATINDLNKQLETQAKIIDTVGIHSQQAADAVTGSLLAVINSQIMAGKSFHDAVVAIGPSVDALSEQMIAAGYSGSAAFDFLRGQVALVNDAVSGPALNAIEGYTQGLVGLNNAGLLTQDIFSGLTSQIGQTEAALIAQGKDPAQVLSAMRGSLQTMWELEQKFGYQTDEATQALIDQAKEQGLVGDKFKPIGEQMLDATNRIAYAIEGLAEVFGVLPKAAKDAATGINVELGKIKTPTINIPISATTTASIGGPPENNPTNTGAPFARGGLVTRHAQYLADGGTATTFTPKGTDTVPAMLTPGERVLNVTQSAAFNMLMGQGGSIVGPALTQVPTKTITDITPYLSMVSDKMSNAADTMLQAANTMLQSVLPSRAQTTPTGFLKGDNLNTPVYWPASLPGFEDGSDGVQDFGEGTLAVLHGREAVVTEDQLKPTYEFGPPKPDPESQGSVGAWFGGFIPTLKTALGILFNSDMYLGMWREYNGDGLDWLNKLALQTQGSRYELGWTESEPLGQIATSPQFTTGLMGTPMPEYHSPEFYAGQDLLFGITEEDRIKGEPSHTPSRELILPNAVFGSYYGIQSNDMNRFWPQWSEYISENELADTKRFYHDRLHAGFPDMRGTSLGGIFDYVARVSSSGIPLTNVSDGTLKAYSDFKSGGPSVSTPASFASGSGGLRDFGTGTLAVLHGQEEVRTAAQVHASETTTNNSSTSNASQTFIFPVVIPPGATPAQIADAIDSKIATIPELARKNTRGFRSDLLASLGQKVTTWT